MSAWEFMSIFLLDAVFGIAIWEITAPSKTILECSEDDAKKIMAASKATVNIEDSP